jgi:hypothetical protein
MTVPGTHRHFLAYRFSPSGSTGAQELSVFGIECLPRAYIALYKFLKTANLSCLAPEAYLRDQLAVIDDYPADRVGELLP